MNRKQLENLCEVNGIFHFQLKNKEDLLKVFGIKVEQLEGFENLSDENKELFIKFLINYYNMLGVDSKLCLEPISIHFVEKYELSGQVDASENFWDTIETIYYILDSSSNRTGIFKNYKYKKCQYLKTNGAELHEVNESFLRFDYKWNLTDGVVNEWLHVTDENTWY